MKIIAEKTADKQVTDKSGHQVQDGEDYFEALWLESHGGTRNSLRFELKDKEVVFLFKESVIYPFVNFHAGRQLN